jgi:vacuolar-type H+-ATPase subunit H
MAEVSLDAPDDQRLRELLAVEQRLQDLVRSAKEQAARRVAAARTAQEQRLAAARAAAEQADTERARAERVAHEQALEAIATAHRATLAVVIRISGARVDELARWALVQAIAISGELA